MPPRFPSLYQLNTRVWLEGLSHELGRAATLDDIADAELDRLAALGFDWLWFLSVWETGAAAQKISRTHPEWQQDFRDTLSDLHTEDIVGSGFAIRRYIVAEALGGDAALARLRHRLHQRGLRLMLDFVPNHCAPDHSWVEAHPEYFIAGSEEEITLAPENFTRVRTSGGTRILAYGRDPHFSGWPDTLQLNYGNPALQQTMIGELHRIAGQCDGVRCDMAMLLLPDVFERTWGIAMEEFWPRAIDAARQRNRDFLFMAEVYWDMEWAMQQQGFDYAYDKRLYDRLHAGEAQAVREHLQAEIDYQNKLARFLENHDEPRAAKVFPCDQHAAAAVVSFLVPGLRLFHQGQFEGRRKRISPHLGRAPEERVDGEIQVFYQKLLEILQREIFRNGTWRLVECVPVWQGNDSHHSFITSVWEGVDGERVVVVVNFSPQASQCFVRLPFGDLRGRTWELDDLFSEICYEREGDALDREGLYVDLGTWGFHVLRLKALE